ncbi:MAG: GNAT family N-acetyltransferase [Candidatus Hydrogenedentes bacterium]|nr:GNAT family N-acetyltransferase [Candidatus Hydrogenedentota bacterium]
MGELILRAYRPEDEVKWMRTHAIILSISHSWNYSIQERPLYKEYLSTKLVVLDGEEIVGLTDVQYEKEPKELCFLDDSLGGYVLEFGRLPEYAGRKIGEMLIAGAVEDAKKKGFNRLEYWSQDRRAQRYYRRVGMKEIGRHYRFRIKPPQPVQDMMMAEYVGVEYLYCACSVEEWPLVKTKFEVMEKHPMEPHLCVGFEIRF